MDDWMAEIADPRAFALTVFLALLAVFLLGVFLGVLFS